MKLVHFALQNYRSIQQTEQIALSDLTVLIGPNNEGKSNILTGLVTGMRILRMYSEPLSPGADGARLLAMAQRRQIYDPERDLPIFPQRRRAGRVGPVVFDFEFELTADEVVEFKQEVKSNLNGRLPVRLTIHDDSLKFEVRKQGRGAKTLSSKSRQISRFVGSRIALDHIPAVRTGASAIEIVRRMVETELQSLEQSSEYQLAVARVAELQQPVLDSLQDVLRGSLSTFLPDVTRVEVAIKDRMHALRRDCEVIVDDGVATSLTQKGDGIQSVAALSLAHHLASRGPMSRAVLLAIEEPEAHLHPRAIHALGRVLREISHSQQVIITTHSPMLANRADPRKNVIVHRNRARAAASLADVRDILGVHVADNLSGARLVLLVEGETDVLIMRALLTERSPGLREQIEDGQLAIMSMRGARNLQNQLGLLRAFLCEVHVFLDHDQPGRAAAAKAQSEGLLEPSEVQFTCYPGMKDAELEDLLEPSSYEEILRSNYGVTLSDSFSKRRARWSDRIERELQAHGQTTDLSQIKHSIARGIAKAPADALASAASSVIDALSRNLERRLHLD